MRCTRCAGLVLERYGQWACLNCGHDPFLVLITVKCATVDCRQLPELHGYCLTCWHSRKRSELSDQERSKRYRDRQRGYQRVRRAKEKEQRCQQLSTIIDNPCGSLPEDICAGAMSVEPGDSIKQAE